MSAKVKEPIAIVGSACRFAGGSNSPSKLWETIREPSDHRRVIPESRFYPDGFYQHDGSRHDRTDVKHAYLLDGDPAAFDAEFFGVKPVEAKALDPQQRFLMEVAYEALENAGIPLSYLKGSDTGVYVGSMFHDYASIVLRDLTDLPLYAATGTGASLLSNRLSYFFDWHGPSVTLDTACSSSLVALHLAVQALRNGEARVALVCGVNLILGPENFIIESKLKMLSPDGRSRMWDQDANGYARGEGVGVLVLKTLHAAEEDGDDIECVIRETAINQDGASESAGITMPNAAAQEALIRTTYAKAGLDLNKAGDEPQYFEAHGTGTPAGDPKEAQAVYNSFFAHGKEKGSIGPPLYVGSVKTVLGHTEGSAGVAAIMKTSLALKHGVIPPNLLFNQLSERVAPFYKGMEIPTTTKAWPHLTKEGGKRRASVNSFGFGGTNAHAILESYHEKRLLEDYNASHSTAAPYVFSALTEESLRTNLSAFAVFLNDQGPKINAIDLCWTLDKRRSTFPHRVAFPASSIEDLSVNIAASLENGCASSKALSGSKKGRILGIFTGQGAQYPQMGAELIQRFTKARAIIENLEGTLASLPDGPEWSLKAELLADASTSRIHQADISQPLCTALQILLVDLLKLSGISFDAVIGHSSGEIAAAYAAGYLTAKDAMCIAYYRGVHLKHASSSKGSHINGAMLAVGSSAQDLEELCQDPVFDGRVNIAAFNSSSSFTVSGDEDAISELQILLDDENKFNRRLKVDKAYHSNHMLPCFDHYVASLRQCGIQPQQPSPTCTWVSSVNGHRVGSSLDLAVGYWAENMVRPVLFSEAIENAIKLSDAPYDLVMELGGHPALKAPVMQTLSSVMGRDLPYTGLLTRGLNAIQASSAALGFAWAHLESGRVDLDRYNRTLSDINHRPQIVKDLPSYCWNHKTKYWHEPRVSRRFRARKNPTHRLLGDPTPDSAAHHRVWKNRLYLKELEWISGHRVQGQIVFPAAGYLATAMEAARPVANAIGKQVRLIDIGNFVVHQALVFDRYDIGIEVLVQLTGITTDDKAECIRAKFTYSAALPSTPDELTLVASGDLDIHLGPISLSLLPERNGLLPHMIDVETERFYQALGDLGYGFSSRFMSLTELKRRHFRSSSVIKPQDHEGFLIHPVELDAALQACILAYSYPYDEKLRSLYLPTTIQRIRINPAILLDLLSTEEVSALHLDAAIRPKKASSRSISGDISMYPSTTSHCAVQIENATFVPLVGHAEEEQDRRVFSKNEWINTSIDDSLVAETIPLTDEHERMVLLLERIATFYLRQFDSQVPLDDPKRSKFPTNYYLTYARHVTSTVKSGKHKWARHEWLHDTLDDILEASSQFSSVADVEIMHLVGNQMPRVFRGETTMLEEFRSSATDGILDRYYAEGHGLKESAQWVGRVVAQIANRYPHMNIMEVGAGTGGATKEIFHNIGQRFRSYTYTDISAAFFDNASRNLPQYGGRIIFSTFDAEKDPVQQGYSEGAYDLIVAFFVIHATSSLERALRNIRKLLRPGGFIVVGEGFNEQNGVVSSGFIFGTLPGWWLGAAEDERDLSPLVSPGRWNSLLQHTGFSGIDFTVPTSWNHLLSVNHFVSQAVDDQVNFLREPLNPSSWRPPTIKRLVIIGGRTNQSLRLVEGLKKQLENGFSIEVIVVDTLTDLDYESVADANTTMISLTELDKPIFQDITKDTFEALKNIFQSGKTLLWVTNGRVDSQPFSNMTVGFGRVAVNESPDLRLQQLDILDTDAIDPNTMAEIFLRFYAARFQDSGLLWSQEPEIMIDSGGRQLLSRLRPIPELNDRYNSENRAIICKKKIYERPVVLDLSLTGCIIKELSTWEISVSKSHFNNADLATLHISHAIVSAIRTPVGYRFLVLGVRPESDVPYLALAPSLASVLAIPEGSALPVQVAPGTEQDMLASIASHLIGLSALNAVYSGQTVLLHNATEGVARAFTMQAALKDVDIILTSDSAEKYHSLPSGKRMPRILSESNLDSLILAEPVVFIDLGTEACAKASKNLTFITSKLPTHCRLESEKTLFSLAASGIASSCSTSILSETLNIALQFAQNDLGHRDHSSISLANIAGGPLPQNPLTVLDLVCDDMVPVHASRLDTRPFLKGAGSTYWIAGMTGALGISICDWMIHNGARNIVLTSRRPDVSPRWISAHKRRGASVMVISCDITDESQVIAVHERVRKSLPPISGVVNGAMVLRDVSVRNMTFEQLTEVVKPKVDGSIHLDRLFYNTNLDFFVLVSSINCIIGNWGQANYAAANTFMCGLAAERRKRGLRAAAINVGAIVGAGYMERETRRALDAVVQKLSMMRLSEEDWHQAIGEAIDASRLESAHGPELTAGLSDVALDASDVPPWFSNPRFFDFVLPTKLSPSEINETKTTLSVQDILRECSSKEDVRSVVLKAFSDQLRSILQVTRSDEDLMASHSNELGFDSLVSVDIRSWFLKHLQVNVPVLKIMDNDIMLNLVNYAVENLPVEMIPLVDMGDHRANSRTSIEARTPGSEASTESEAKISITLQQKIENDEPERIDWNIESMPPPCWTDIPISSNSPPCTPPNVIVLTGVSGLLGHHLLEHLLKHTSVRTIHCLAVRRLDTRLQEKELLIDPRVKYHSGELSEPLLGLSADEAASIFNSADAVIHNGAETSHTKLYSELRAANVGSTFELARLCLPRRVPLHYVSSAGVAIYYNQPVFPEVSVMGPGSLYPASDGSFGYACCKWVNERFFERLHAQFHVPVYIYRPSTIIREGADLDVPRAQLDWVNALLTYIRKLRSAPKVEHNQGSLDLVRVESCCADLAKYVACGGNELKYVNQVGDVVIPIARMHDMDVDIGRHYDSLPLREWTKKAVTAGLHPGVALLIEKMDAPGQLTYPKLLRETVK